MKQITMIGIDLAKNVFQLHGVDANHQPVLRRQLRRTQMLPFFAKLPPCTAGLSQMSQSVEEMVITPCGPLTFNSNGSFCWN